jgi:hypothetical protein
LRDDKNAAVEIEARLRHRHHGIDESIVNAEVFCQAQGSFCAVRRSDARGAKPTTWYRYVKSIWDARLQNAPGGHQTLW